MDASELALKMLEWEKKYDELMALEDEIKGMVLEAGKTQVVGYVRARYSGGRRSYDYEGPVLNMRARAIQECDEVTIAHVNTAIEMHTETRVTTNYRNVCDSLGIKGIVTGKSEPSVTIKLERP